MSKGSQEEQFDEILSNVLKDLRLAKDQKIVDEDKVKGFLTRLLKHLKITRFSEDEKKLAENEVKRFFVEGVNQDVVEGRQYQIFEKVLEEMFTAKDKAPAFKIEGPSRSKRGTYARFLSDLSGALKTVGLKSAASYLSAMSYRERVVIPTIDSIVQKGGKVPAERVIRTFEKLAGGVKIERSKYQARGELSGNVEKILKAMDVSVEAVDLQGKNENNMLQNVGIVCDSREKMLKGLSTFYEIVGQKDHSKACELAFKRTVFDKARSLGRRILQARASGSKATTTVKQNQSMTRGG